MSFLTPLTEQSSAADASQLPVTPDREFTIGHGKVSLMLVSSGPGNWASIFFTTTFPSDTDCAPFAPQQQKKEVYVDDYEARNVFFNYTQQHVEALYDERLAFYTDPQNRKAVNW